MSTSTVPAADPAPTSMIVRAHARAAASAMCEEIQTKARVELDRQNQMRAAELAAEVARAKSAVHKTWLASVAVGVTALATLFVSPLVSTSPSLSSDAESAVKAPALELEARTATSGARAVREQGPSQSRSQAEPRGHENASVQTAHCDENDPMAFCLGK